MESRKTSIAVEDRFKVVPFEEFCEIAHVGHSRGYEFLNSSDVTCAVSYEHPYTLARRFSTLDHLTGGRIGWNVVTGYLNSAAKGIGLARQHRASDVADQAAVSGLGSSFLRG